MASILCLDIISDVLYFASKISFDRNMNSHHLFMYLFDVTQATRHGSNQWWENYLTQVCILCIPDFIDDVIEWKRFPCYGRFVRGNPPVTGGFPAQRVGNAGFDVSFDDNLSNRLNKQSTCRWIETQCRSYDVIVMLMSQAKWKLYSETVA